MSSKSTKEYYRKVNRVAYSKDYKTGLGFSYNVVIPQILAQTLGIDKDSILKFTFNW